MTIWMSVPGIAKKNEQSNIVKIILTAATIEDQCPHKAWLQVYTDGSATDATRYGKARAYIWHPNRERKTQTTATDVPCTNYKAKVEAIIFAANTIRSRVDHNTQVVILTDALSVLQAFNSGQLPQLEKALHNIQCLCTVLQWITSHCGIEGSEQADKKAKTGAQEEQLENPVCLAEQDHHQSSLQTNSTTRQLRQSRQTRPGDYLSL